MGLFLLSRDERLELEEEKTMEECREESGVQGALFNGVIRRNFYHHERKKIFVILQEDACGKLKV